MIIIWLLSMASYWRCCRESQILSSEDQESMEDDGCQSAFLNGEPISKVSIASDTIFKEKKVVQSDRYQTSHLSAAKNIWEMF